jgi:hypothetical protein
MVRSLRVLSHERGRLVVETRASFLPLPSRFEVDLRDGWCLMRSGTYLVGMAAEPLGDQTRYAHLEGLPYRRAQALRVLRPVFRRIVGGDVRGIVRMLATPP